MWARLLRSPYMYLVRPRCSLTYIRTRNSEWQSQGLFIWSIFILPYIHIIFNSVTHFRIDLLLVNKQCTRSCRIPENIWWWWWWIDLGRVRYVRASPVNSHCPTRPWRQSPPAIIYSSAPAAAEISTRTAHQTRPTPPGYSWTSEYLGFNGYM